MAHLPVAVARVRHNHQPGAVDVSAQWRHTRVDWRAGGGVLCKGIRHYLPRPTPKRTRREGQGSSAFNARGDGLADGSLCFSRTVPDGISPFVRAANGTTAGSAAAEWP